MAAIMAGSLLPVLNSGKMPRTDHAMMRLSNGTPEVIRDVWADNLEEEFVCIRDLLRRYSWVAIDTEFPGVVARPLGSFRSSTDYHYQTLRVNVDLLNIIQVGLTFTDSEGNLPPSNHTWQFHFRFSLEENMYAQDSIDLLTRSGINFQKLEERGIDPDVFGELMISSGLVLDPHVKWLSFHSGYDFGYLLKILTCAPLPSEEGDFFDILHTYFPCIYDIKYVMKGIDALKGGLQDVAEELGVKRIGPQHQAGSDGLLTSATFFKLRKVFFDNRFDDKAIVGVLYGLGSGGSSMTKLTHF